MVDKWSIKPSLATKLVDILSFANDNDVIKTEMVVEKFAFSETSITATLCNTTFSKHNIKGQKNH